MQQKGPIRTQTDPLPTTFPNSKYALITTKKEDAHSRHNSERLVNGNTFAFHAISSAARIFTPIVPGSTNLFPGP